MVRKIGIGLLMSFVILSAVYQLFDLYRFVNSGARFTLQDGQALCARVLRLESIQATLVAAVSLGVANER